MKKGFTLLEIVIIIVIISLLSTIALPNYMRSREILYDNQAKADLKIVVTAQQGYKIDMNTYFTPSTSVSPDAIIEINNALGLSLPFGESRKWNYTIDSSGCTEAIRAGEDERTWHLNINDTEPTSGGCS